MKLLPFAILTLQQVCSLYAVNTDVSKSNQKAIDSHVAPQPHPAGIEELILEQLLKMSEERLQSHQNYNQRASAGNGVPSQSVGTVDKTKEPGQKRHRLIISDEKPSYPKDQRMQPTKRSKFGQPEEPFPPPIPTVVGPGQPAQKRTASDRGALRLGDSVFVAAIAVGVVAGVLGIIGAAVFYRRIQQGKKLAEGCEYEPPKYGPTGPNLPTSNGSSDATLSSSAYIHNYQQRRMEILNVDHSVNEDEEVDEEATNGDGGGAPFHVYECPGLAPTGDIEINNPLFDSNLSSSLGSLSNTGTSTTEKTATQRTLETD